MYVAVKGGERAISNAHKLLYENKKDENIPDISLEQIKKQFSYAIDRIMAEGSLYDPDLAAKAMRQAQGDMVEAIFLIRAFRNTIPRFGYTSPIDTKKIDIKRRISATYKDIPGGQILGPTFDYTHRLLGVEDPYVEDDTTENKPIKESTFPRVTTFLEQEELIITNQCENREVGDLTRNPVDLPTPRDIRLQNLSRGDEGFLLSLAYSYERGFGGDAHPFAAEIRNGDVEILIEPDELGFEICIGKMNITEVVMVDSFHGDAEKQPQFASGYGLCFGKNERKAMSMAIVDRSMRHDEFNEEDKYPSQNHEFVIYHSDNVEASGFVSHLKLPHYVDFQSELAVIRRLKKKFDEKSEKKDRLNGNKTPSKQESGQSV